MKKRRNNSVEKPQRENRVSGQANFKAKTRGQSEYIQTVCENTVTFCVGPAGTGKTACSVGLACQKLTRGEVDKIIVTRPCVEAAPKSIGHLPGSVLDKVIPYLAPAIEHMKRFLGRESYNHYYENGQIIIEPLEFMRGKTFDDTFIIGEEFQNATWEQIVMFITRIGENSRMVISGDIEQIDIKHSAHTCDLQDMITLVEKARIKEFGVYELTELDVVRNKILQPFLHALKTHGRKTV